MDLPFQSFKIDNALQVVCFITTDLGNDTFLFSAGLYECDEDDEEIIKYSAYSWWIGRLVYVEGIGGRQMLDTNHIDVMVTSVNRFGDTLRPSTKEVMAALDRAQSEKEVFNRRFIQAIDS